MLIVAAVPVLVMDPPVLLTPVWEVEAALPSTSTSAVPLLMAPEMLTPVSGLDPVSVLASPMMLMAWVEVPLLLMVPEKLTPFKPPLLDAAVVPLMVSLLLVPVMLRVPPKEIPSELLLEPSSVTSPLMLNTFPSRTKIPRCLVLRPVDNAVPSPASVKVVPLMALAAPFPNVMNAPKPSVVVVEPLKPFTTLAVLVPLVPVVLMLPPCHANPVLPVLLNPVALR